MTPERQSADTVHPTSWFACPFCHAAPHEPCRSRQSQRTYPMGSFHWARRQYAARNDGEDR